LAAGLVLGVLVARFTSGLHQPVGSEDSVAAQAGGEDATPGRWRDSGGAKGRKAASAKLKTEVERLQSLGYLAGSRPAPKKSGVTAYEKGRAHEGLNLVVSGHAPEAYLMDMSGAVLHTWTCDVHRPWPEFKVEDNIGESFNHTFWRRAHLLPNGDILAIFERIGLIKLDRHSQLLWAVKNRAHHDLDLAENGDIYVLTGEARLNEEYNPRQPIWEDSISVLDPQGTELKKVSVLRALQNSEYAAVLNEAQPAGDLLHTNTVELIEELPSMVPAPFRKGSVLIAILYLDLVCAVDLGKETVYWAESDFWHRQHQPTLLGNGHLLVLDNQRSRNTSAVLELDPVSRQIQWSYIGGRDGEFYTETCGSCQRLPNGNTLITESDAGRAFEITPEKKIVWEYLSPHRAGANRELVATLFEVLRLEKDVAEKWLR
jgi:hypothetical protein